MSSAAAELKAAELPFNRELMALVVSHRCGQENYPYQDLARTLKQTGALELQLDAAVTRYPSLSLDSHECVSTRVVEFYRGARNFLQRLRETTRTIEIPAELRGAARSCVLETSSTSSPSNGMDALDSFQVRQLSALDPTFGRLVTIIRHDVRTRISWYNFSDNDPSDTAAVVRDASDP